MFAVDFTLHSNCLFHDISSKGFAFVFVLAVNVQSIRVGLGPIRKQLACDNFLPFFYCAIDG